MKFIRKALWPTAIVAAVLMLFGALGSASNAETLGDVQSSSGDDVVEAGEEIAVYVVVEGDADPAAAKKAAVADAVDALVDADTPAAIAKAEAALRTALIAAGVVADAEISTQGNIDVNLLEIAVINLLEDTTITEAIAQLTVVKNAADTVKALVTTTASPVLYTSKYTVEVDGNAEITGALIAGGDPSAKDGSFGELKDQSSGRTRVSGITPVKLSSTVASHEDLEDFDLPSKGDILLVVVECTSGSFEVSFESDAAGGLSESATFDCQGNVADAEISASKSTVYSADSAKSDITVTITDKDGTSATPGVDVVVFTTEACDFGGGKKGLEVQSSEADDGNTIAEATLDCSGADAGVATVTAMIDKPGPDILMTTTVTVIGPPASLTVLGGSMMDDDALTCGEVAKVTITVVDSAGQPVADGTEVNLTTNIAGVLVLPVTTSDGAADAYLITSNANVGSYAVVVQSGSAIGYHTVTCEAAAAPAPMEAPAITPPSTGNAGLAETSGSSWMLLVIAGALASVMVAVGKGMPLFFRR